MGLPVGHLEEEGLIEEEEGHEEGLMVGPGAVMVLHHEEACEDRHHQAGMVTDVECVRLKVCQ
jgi:hypothetical protein